MSQSQAISPPLSRQSTLIEEQDKKTSHAPSTIAESQRGPDPPPPSKTRQNARLVKYWLKAQFKADPDRPYNPHSGF
jgi:hypothetical protein